MRALANLIAAGIDVLGRGGDILGFREAFEALRALDVYADRRIVFVHPIEDVIPRLVLDRIALRKYGVVAVPNAVFVCSDSIVGRLAADVLEVHGRPSLGLASKAGGRRISNLQSIVREARPVCIVSNGIGLDGAMVANDVHPRLWALFERRRAVVVPVAVACSSALRLRWPGRIVVPAPMARIAVAVGGEVDVLVGDRSSCMRRFLELARDASLHAQELIALGA